MGFVEGNKERGESSVECDKSEGTHDSLSRQHSESSVYATDQEEEDEDGNKIELGPQCTLKEQLDKDKDDESLRKWKEQLLGSVDVNNIGEILEPEVKITSLSIISPGRDDIVLPTPENGKPQGLWFTLKEGSQYILKFTFEVSNNIVSGFKYTNTVWKTGVKVDSSKEMLEHSAHRQSLIHMRCQKKLHHLGCLQEANILQDQSFLMMTTNVTWRLTMLLISEGSGLNHITLLQV